MFTDLLNFLFYEETLLVLTNLKGLANEFFSPFKKKKLLNVLFENHTDVAAALQL